MPTARRGSRTRACAREPGARWIHAVAMAVSTLMKAGAWYPRRPLASSAASSRSHDHARVLAL